MEELQNILTAHHSKLRKSEESFSNGSKVNPSPSTSKIPDLFFDNILIQYKLTRSEVIVLMYLYRLTWCKPNLDRKYGITPMISYEVVSSLLDIEHDSFHQIVLSLEGYGFIETIRSGQYFVRRYFTEENDQKYGLTYENFL